MSFKFSLPYLRYFDLNRLCGRYFCFEDAVLTFKVARVDFLVLILSKFKVSATEKSVIFS